MKVRWWRILAAIVGAWIALWLLSGDTTPEAAGQITSFDVTISQFHVREAKDIYMFSIGGGTFALDPDLPLAKWLKTHPGKATLTLEAK